MYKVGLTGNFYSGQDEIALLFQDNGIKVFNANLQLKYFVNFSPEHIDKIKIKFGNSIYSLGLLNLNKFTTNQHFDDLFSILEVDILKSYEKFRHHHKNEFYTIFLFDQLFERKINLNMNFNISCFRPKDIRKKDISLLTSLDSYTITKILDNEMQESIKNSKSDFIIRNYNHGKDWESDIVIGLENQIKTVHQRIMDKKLESQVTNLYY